MHRLMATGLGRWAMGDGRWAMGDGGSRSISRVLSRTVIHLDTLSPAASSSLPGNTAGRGMVPLFGLAPGGVCRAVACCHRRGALLPHLFTLTTHALRRRSAVCFLWHFPSAHAAQALPGTLPYGARTFLRALLRRDSLTNSAAHFNRMLPTASRLF